MWTKARQDFWSDQRVADLKQMYVADALSAAEIAKRISTAEHPISRCAVLGKLNRLGIVRNLNAAQQIRRRREGAPRAKKVGLKWGAFSNGEKPPSLPPAPQPPAEVEGRALTVRTLPQSGACKFPYDKPGVEGGFIFCGHPSMRESPWCEAHAAIVFNPQPKKAA